MISQSMIIMAYLLSVALILCFIFRKELAGKEEKQTIDGDTFIKAVKVFSVVDEGILRSMLESAEIDTKSDSTNFQRIQFGNLTSCLYGITIYVKREDIDEARVIITDFISNKRKSQIESNQKKIRKTLSTLFIEPALHKEIPELLI